MAVSAGSVYVDLGAKLDRREFEAYERELKKVQERTARREHFKAQLGADFDNRAFSAYERELKKAHGANDDMVKANGRLRTSFGNVWARGGAAFAAVGGAVVLVGAVKSVVSAYGDAETSAKRVQVAVENAGISYKNHATEIDKVIQAQSKLSAFDDEDLADTFAKFVTSTKNVNESLRLNALTTDVARGRQISLEAAQRLVARASQGNATALKRLGIEIDPVTKATDKLKDSHDKSTTAQKNAAKETDKNATAQKTIAALQKQFGGQAEQYGKTQQGAIGRLSVAWENLRETIGKHLAPVITDAASKAAKFIDEMDTGRGKGGAFVREMREDWVPILKQFYGALKTAGGWVRKFGDDFNSNERQVGGWITGLGRGESAVLKFTGKLVGGTAGDKLREWGHNVDVNADKIDRWRQELKITREVDKIEDDLDRLKNKTNGTLHGILVSTHKNMDNIRDTMGEESSAGQRALHKNFQAAVTAIRTAMHEGNISTKTGLAQIRREMQQELKTLGIDSAERGGLPLSKHAPKGDLPVTTQSTGVTKYGGGWIGAPGMIGQDIVPAMLAPGEAVLNRHQQAVIEGMLGGGFLDKLFANVTRPHFMARGGRARFAIGGAAGAGDRRTLGFSDLEGLWESVGGRSSAAAIMAHIAQAESGGNPTARNPSGASGLWQILGLPFPGNPFDPATNARMAIAKSGNGANLHPWDASRAAWGKFLGATGEVGPTTAGPALVARVWKALKAPQTSMTGLLGDVVQGTLTRATSLANQHGRALAAAAGPASPGGTSGPAGTTSFKGITMAKWVADALRYAQSKGVESQPTSGYRPGFDPHTASGASEHQGLQYPHGAVDFGSFTSGLGPKMAVVNATRDFRYPLLAPIGFRDDGHASGTGHARGGFIRRFASGGKQPPPSASVAKAVSKEHSWLDRTWAKIRPLYGVGSPSLESLFTRIAFTNANPFVGVAWDAGNQEGTPELDWPRWIWQSQPGQKALDEKTKLKLLLHEMTHRFQSPAATKSVWQAEGGAEAFARLMMSQHFGGYPASKNRGDPYNPYVDRVRKLGTKWITRTQFGRAAGGVIQRFASGGRVAASTVGAVVGKAAGGTKLNIKSLRGLQTDRIGNFDTIMGRVDDARDTYQRLDTRYGLTDEGDLIDSETGEPNVGAIQQKLKELANLAIQRKFIEDQLIEARKIARRVVKTYQTIVAALRKSLAHAKGKDRSGIRSKIKTYQDRLGGDDGWVKKVKDLGGDIYDAHTDVLEIGGELKEAQGALGGDNAIRAQHAADLAPDAGDTSSGDTGTAGDAIADTPTAPTAADIAAGVIQELATFQQGRVDLLSAFAPNFASARQAYSPGGAFSGSPDDLTAAAGVRYFGATGGGSLGMGAGGPTVVIQDGAAFARFASAPADAPTFMQQVRFQVENGVG